MGIIVGVVTFPVGVAAAIYLTEYARDSWVNRLLQTNISNLAGVPSIIYGILGLALFVRLLGLGSTILAAGLTLTLLILPVVIIASIEAFKAVPQAQREGAYALGATRWQMVRGSVLPAAAPGIMTGIILAMARAIGEAAPLILIGAFAFVTFLPNPISGSYTVLPIQIFDWARRPQDDFAGISAAAIIVILVLMLRPQRTGPHRPSPPLEAYPVVEENPVNTQLSEAPAREPATDGGGPAIRLATMARDHASASSRR